MALPVELRCPNGDPNQRVVEAHQRGNREVGIVAYTEDLVETRPFVAAYVNSEFGTDLAQEVAFSGTPELVHDGTDTAAWTGTTVSGSAVDFSSTNRAFDGANSVRFNSESVGTVGQFDRGSTIAAGTYSALTMQVNINRRWEAGDEVSMYAWDTGTDTQVGTKATLDDFVDEGNNDVWQAVTIPFSVFGIENSSFDAFRVEVEAASGTSPDFFLDAIELQESGNPIEFRLTAPLGRRFYIRELVLSMAYADGSTLADGSMPAIDYTKWGNLTLATGVRFDAVSQGIASFAQPVKDLGGLLAVGTRLETAISDGTNTFLQLVTPFAKPRILYGNNRSYLAATINDDMSSLQRFQIFARGELEIPYELTEQE